MTTALIGVIVLILLIISFVPNYRAMKSAKEQGSNATRATIMVGIRYYLNCTYHRDVIIKIYVTI